MYKCCWCKKEHSNNTLGSFCSLACNNKCRDFIKYVLEPYDWQKVEDEALDKILVELVGVKRVGT